MALYAPFYAGKNAPAKAKQSAKKSSPVRSKTRKTNKLSCSNAAKTLRKCRTKRGVTRSQCKDAGKILYGCRTRT